MTQRQATIYLIMGIVGLALIIHERRWLRRNPSGNAGIEKMDRGRLLFIGILLLTGGCGGLLSSLGSRESDERFRHLLPLTNRCSTPLQFTVPNLDGSETSYEVLAGRVGVLTIDAGTEVHVRSTTAENTFVVSDTAPQFLQEWVVVGNACTTLAPDVPGVRVADRPG